nr:transposase [Rhodococcus fascians]
MRDVTSLIAKCTSTGPNFGIYAERILDDPLPWTRIRSVYRLQGLVRRYGAERVDQACSLSLDLDVVSVTKIASMLGAPPNPPRRINRKRSDNLRLDSPATQPNSVLLQSHLFPS